MDISKHPPDADYVEKHPSPVESDPSSEDPRVKAIKRKVDIRLSATLAVMYIVNQIDRSNLSNAVVAGMDDTLVFEGTNRYSIIVLLFFPTYVLFQPIATVVARRLGPRPFPRGYYARFWAGAFEACFFPSALFLVSMWYVRREVAKRNAFFYLVGNGVGGFGGVLAYGLQQMDGLGGLEGWRWIFIMEGVMTAVIALVGYVFLIDFPEDAHRTKSFLASEEIKIMVDRVERDRGDAHVTPFSLKNYLAQGKDWKVWVNTDDSFFALNFGLSGLVTYAVSYFLPIILRNTLGFSVVQAQCLTAPCYAFSFLLGFTESYLSDKYNLRAPVLIFNALLEIIGIAILGYASQPYVRYFGAFLITGGANSNIPASMTYQANNVIGQWRRAFTAATIVAAGGVGGVIGSVAFRPQDFSGIWTRVVDLFCSGGGD
ncbi:phthalate transporter like protein [Zymoseptoria brevis]|uniref:Phthalate transporter like protein n=1 Tax=Zymoseptoria brevis TaxID=1047168 RepID=A0A0F4GNU9_9PEZI|nr:phthalate transporter like protein [Zymoseptoria brevis]